MRPRLVLVALVVGALIAAILLRWGTDDAWISFVYAKSLVEGDGLTWFGTHVEGYTNFLWVMWSAAGLALGIDPLVWAWGGSLAAMAGALVATHRIVRLRTASAVVALTATAVLATNYTFLAFGTSGLETMLQTALLAVLWWQVERMRRSADAPSPRALAGASAIAALAILTRLDSAVIVLVLAVALVGKLRGARAWLAAIAPAALLLGTWLVWKLGYYGGILPNTAHAKVGFGGAILAHGALHVARFLHAYLLWPVLIAVVATAIARKRFTARLPAAIAIAWLAYVIGVGGDFMEFRFFVPVLPALAVIVAETLVAAAASPGSAGARSTPGGSAESIEHPKVPAPHVRAGLVVVLLAAMSFRHAVTFEGVAEDKSYDSVTAMATFYGNVPDGDWGRLGRPLHDTLAGTGATLACQGAGAIPYFAELPTVDQLGLNDAWVAANGDQPSAEYARPGHQRWAPLSYLVEQHVTFVIGSPMLIPRGRLHQMPPRALSLWLAANFTKQPTMPDTVVVVAAALDESRSLLLWYLTPNPLVDARIRAAGWETRELRRRKQEGRPTGGRNP